MLFYSLLLRTILFIFVFLFSAPLYSYTQFTHSDTLRGFLSAERICFDVHYYHLRVTIDTATHSISGSNEIVFTTLSQTERIQLDLFANMTIDSIVFHRLHLAFERDSNAFFVDFPGYLMENTQQTIKVFYHGVPVQAKKAPWDGGFVWKRDAKGNPWIGVACEGVGASLWWPNKDHLSDEPDSMRISCEVPKGLQCVANGNLERVEKSTTSSTFHWMVHYPINNYNVTMNIGDYVHFSEYYFSGKDSMSCDYYVLPEHFEKAKEHFKQVKPMLAIYEQLFGSYPFWQDGYALVETPYLGMEHQGAISYGNQYMRGYLGQQMPGIDFDYIIVHESGHEYWGNSVSVKDYADLWIHEGFCTYTEALYVEQRYGYATALRYLQGQLLGIDNDMAIIGPYNVNAEGSGDRYNKGAWMLHTIRNVIKNDSLWFATLKGICLDFKFKTVDSKEIENYLSQHLKVDLTALFDQYLRKKALPILRVVVDEKCRKVLLTVRLESAVAALSLPVQYSVDGGENWLFLFGGAPIRNLILTKKEYAALRFSTHLHLFKVEKEEALKTLK
jgi:aminopeptidase N